MSNEIMQTAFDLNLNLESFVPSTEETTEMRVNEVLSNTTVAIKTEIVEDMTPSMGGNTIYSETTNTEYQLTGFNGKKVIALGDTSIITDRPFVAIGLSRFSSDQAIAATEAAALSLAAEGSHNLLVCATLEEDMPMIRKMITGGGCVLVVISYGLDRVEITEELQKFINEKSLCLISPFHPWKKWVRINGQARNSLIATSPLVTSVFIAECLGEQHAWDLAGRAVANKKPCYIPAITAESRKEMSWMRKNGVTELAPESDELDVYTQLI